jgi:uncharacterized protein (DUF58 family)
VTRRAWGLLLGGAALLAFAWTVSWPELTGLGAATVVLVLTVRIVSGPRPTGTVHLPSSHLQVTRGEPACVRLSVQLRRRRAFLAVVEGDPAAPMSTARVPRARSAELPLDSTRRCVLSVGPYALVQSDPWGLVRRVVSSSGGGTLTVLPRVHPVRRELTATRTTGDSELASRRYGDQHFHALRDYVLGDEPRQVHWRSSARAGHLVVRQQVAAASVGLVVVLDVDQGAYALPGRFSTGHDEARFELAVEIAASVATARLGSLEQVLLLTSRRGDTPVLARGSSSAGVLRALAAVEAVPPVTAALEELVAAVRRASAAHLLFVSGDPSHRTATALQRLARLVPSTVVVRVGEPAAVAGLRGLQQVSVRTVEDLT